MRLSVSKGLRAAMVTVVVMLSSNSVSGDSNNIGYYIGASGNAFLMDAKVAVLHVDGDSYGDADSLNGIFAIGLTAGVFLNDRNRINFSHFSGGPTDFFYVDYPAGRTPVGYSTSSTSVSIDHSFNNSGVRRGYFLGAGIARIEIEMEAIELKGVTIAAASSTSGTGLLLRAGYEYQFDNQLLLNVGLNLYPFDLDDIKSENLVEDEYEFVTSPNTYANTYISLNYAF